MPILIPTRIEIVSPASLTNHHGEPAEMLRKYAGSGEWLIEVEQEKKSVDSSELFRIGYSESSVQIQAYKAMIHVKWLWLTIWAVTWADRSAPNTTQGGVGETIRRGLIPRPGTVRREYTAHVA